MDDFNLKTATREHLEYYRNSFASNFCEVLTQLEINMKGLRDEGPGKGLTDIIAHSFRTELEELGKLDKAVIEINAELLRREHLVLDTLSSEEGEDAPYNIDPK